MNMSDKELDQLFQTQLENLEEEPSAGLWNEIQDKIDHKTRRTRFGWVYRIAASILLIGIGAWLIIPERPAMQTAVKTKKAVNFPKAEKATEAQVAIVEKAEASTSVKPSASKKIMLKSEKLEKEATAKPIAFEQVLVSNVQTQTATFHPEIPDLPLAPAILPVGALSESLFKEGQGMEAAEIHTVAVEKKQTKVKNLGDLVNLVIAKVDKREDKIIEFDTDDEEANITAINLGIVRIKREK